MFLLNYCFILNVDNPDAIAISENEPTGITEDQNDTGDDGKDDKATIAYGYETGIASENPSGIRASGCI